MDPITTATADLGRLQLSMSILGIKCDELKLFIRRTFFEIKS